MIAVIGDIHGCYFTLEQLYSKLVSKYPDIPIYCVGDLVDRGNFSYEVVDFFIKKGIRFTPGNHDYMFYDFFKKPGSMFAAAWSYNGNETTLRSYAKRVDMINHHLNYIRSEPLFFDLPDCFISHAGISERYKTKLPKNFRENLFLINKLVENTFEDDEGILWARAKLLNLGKLQIVGHTKQMEIKIDNKSDAAYIDTGACAGAKLSCVIVENSSIIEAISQKTLFEDIE